MATIPVQEPDHLHANSTWVERVIGLSNSTNDEFSETGNLNVS